MSDHKPTPPAGEESLPGAIDVWVNLFTPAACQRVYFETPEMKDVVEWWGIQDIARGMDVESFLKILDAQNVDKVIIPSTKMWAYQRHAWCYSIEVEEVAEAAQQAPDRIFGAFGVNPWEGMTGVRKLEQAVTEHGFVGAHVHPYGWGLPVNAADWYPFYAKCAELEVPVMMQVGHSAEFMPNKTGQPLLVDDIALYFPELKIVCCHMGWPWVEELIALAWKHPNVYVATTAHAPKYWDPKFIRFANSRGKDKVLFGTDWPVINHERARRELLELGLKPEALRKLLHDNAAAVFSRLSAPAPVVS